jgi:hypothetical protein
MTQSSDVDVHVRWEQFLCRPRRARVHRPGCLLPRCQPPRSRHLPIEATDCDSHTDSQRLTATYSDPHAVIVSPSGGLSWVQT